MPVHCPSCQNQLYVGASAVGKTVKCPSCGESLQIPEGAAAGGSQKVVAKFAQTSESAVERKPCPMCGEMIARNAIRCRHCGEDLGDRSRTQFNNSNQAEIEKTFRQQTRALGVFWIFIGLVVGGIGAIGANLANQVNQRNQGILAFDGAVGVFVVIFFVFSVAFLVVGGLTIAKNIPAIYVGLVLTYLLLAGNVISFLSDMAQLGMGAPPGFVCGQIFGGAINLIVIIQAHRVIGWSKQIEL